MSTHLLAEVTKNGPDTNKSYQVYLAYSPDEIEEAQKFRYKIFGEEMGASLPDAANERDVDRFDEYCDHVMVRLNGELVGYTRVLTCAQAERAGGFYSQSEFDLDNILAQQGRFMEIGRTCIHPGHRNGTTISLLWTGLAKFMSENKIDFLMGCASIPENGGCVTAETIMSRLKEGQFSPSTLRVYPRIKLPENKSAATQVPALPPLLKGYLRVGAKICGEPFWDKAFGVADLFILLNRADLDSRYARHFVDRTLQAA